MIETRRGCIAGLLLLLACPASSGQENTALEREVFQALNGLRAEPAVWVRLLEDERRYYRGRVVTHPGRVPIETQEGTRAVDEAIAFLRSSRTSPGPVVLSRGLTRAAREHVRDTGPQGIVGHEGSRGEDFAHRISRFGVWSGSVAENIGYGPDSAVDVILQLLIDDGMRERGHRRNLLDARWGYVGVGCGAHARYGSMCVMDFAAGFEDKQR